MTVSKLFAFIWRPRALAVAVGRMDLSEREQFVLMLFGQVVVFVAAYVGLFMGIVRDWVSGVQAVILLAVTVIGFLWVYRANGADQGSDFVRRFSILSIPLLFKLSLLSWPVFYGLGWVITVSTMGMNDESFELALRVFEFAWNIILTTAFFWRLTHWVRIAKNAMQGVRPRFPGQLS